MTATSSQQPVRAGATPNGVDPPPGALPEALSLEDLGLSEGRAGRLLWGLVALGIGLRLLLYLLRWPLFSDEAKLAISLLDRGYAGLLDPLAHNQVATFAFMWVQETATVVLGFSEYSLRLVPLLAASAAMLFMRRLVRRLFSGASAALALALLAVSYYPVRHAAELKPYATDLLASLVLLALAVEWLREPDRPRWLWALAAAAPIAVAVSYPAIFVVSGILAALMTAILGERRWSDVLPATAAAVLAAGTFLANFLLVGARQYALRSTLDMPMYDGFPPPGDLAGTLTWVMRAHTGRMFAYPIGGEGGLSLLTFLAVVAGAIALYRSGRRILLAMLLLPFGLGLAAALLQRYPYGGSGRVTQHLAPAICLLAGLGSARLLSVARGPRARRLLARGTLALLVVFGLVEGVVLVVRPYRDRPDAVARDFARWFWDVTSRDAVLVCAWDDLRLEFARPPEVWVPGSAGYRLNQRIYRPRDGTGAVPDLSRVSRERPLRVAFLGSALGDRRPDLEEWLADLEARYELVGRELHRLGGFLDQHGREDWVELYTFVPPEGPGSPSLEVPGPRRGWSPSPRRPLGTVDFAICESIGGWARDPDSVQPTLVEVYLEGRSRPIATVWADQPRRDLPTRDHLHGFLLPTPPELKTGRPETFEVLAWDLGLTGELIASGQPITWSRQTLTCEPDGGERAD